jgi:hypothetical protein
LRNGVISDSRDIFESVRNNESAKKLWEELNESKTIAWLE